MKFGYVVIASLLVAALAISGCTSPTPTPSPSAAAPTVTPEASPSATAIVNASTPTPAPTTAPTPTPVPSYSNGSPVSVSDIKIDWDTTSYYGEAHQAATMTVKNAQPDGIVFDVVVLYKVSTPATLVNADGSTENFTNTVTKTENIGLMQPGDQRTITFQADHHKNVPATVSVIVQWRGGKAVVFEKTLTLQDFSMGSYEF